MIALLACITPAPAPPPPPLVSDLDEQHGPPRQYLLLTVVIPRFGPLTVLRLAHAWWPINASGPRACLNGLWVTRPHATAMSRPSQFLLWIAYGRVLSGWPTSAGHSLPLVCLSLCFRFFPFFSSLSLVFSFSGFLSLFIILWSSLFLFLYSSFYFFLCFFCWFSFLTHVNIFSVYNVPFYTRWTFLKYMMCIFLNTWCTFCQIHVLNIFLNTW